MDGASLTFSSQDLGDSQGDSFVFPPSQDDPPPPAIQTPSPSSSGPRLGLNKFALSCPKVGSSSNSKPAGSRSNLGMVGQDSSGRKETSLVAMDAIRFTNSQDQFNMRNVDRKLVAMDAIRFTNSQDQFNMRNVDRKLNKAFVAFQYRHVNGLHISCIFFSDLKHDL